MSLGNRPYVGTWQLNNKTLVRHVPDAIVMLNGFTEFASCLSCNKRIDIQQYLTSVTCDASTDPISSASLSFAIPKHATELFSRDGDFILKTGLEVIILFRGYFPMKNYAGMGQDDEDLNNAANFKANDVSMYPYYQVFRGVVTEASHEYSGGFYTASLSCANLLHFWQNLKVSVNGAVFGRKPASSGVEPHLLGHKFTGANPYSVIYTVTKVGFGAAYGVEFVYAQSTNIRAKDAADQEYQYKHAAQWWEKRWQENSGRLRMYGIDGGIFNAYEQAYLGRWYDTRNKSKGALSNAIKTVRDMFKQKHDFDILSDKEMKKALREKGYDRTSTAAGVYTTDNTGGKSASEDILKMQAFTYDLGRVGSINMFETEYLSKLDIVNSITEITGFEFYQDVDGDLVFKPPFYNLDTRQDPVYVIKDRDLISIDESESEPEVTMMKGTGSHWSNVTGHGVDGWAGVGGVYIDYRLVAQYGWREETFETNYFNSRQAIYLSAVNRLDLANIGIRSGTISIPLRPELRAGYPVYVESEDCFYYAKSVSHSFSFGGEATTSISWVAKRRKWMPPIQASGRPFPKIEDVRLDAPDEFPAQPLLVTTGSGIPRMAGFPNVIMAFDPDRVNYATLDSSLENISVEGFIEQAINTGFLERSEKKDVFLLRRSNDNVEEVPLAELKRQWDNPLNETGDKVYQTPPAEDPSTQLGYLLTLISQRAGQAADIENTATLMNYLAIQNSLKSQFAPGSQIAGKFRYFSCSHPNPEHQAPKTLRVNQETSQVDKQNPENSTDGATSTVLQFKDNGDQGVELTAVPTTNVKGVEILSLSNKAGSSKPQKIIIPSSDVFYVTFSPQRLKKKVQVSSVSATASNRSNFAIIESSFTQVLAVKFYAAAMAEDPSQTIGDRFAGVRDEVTAIYEEYYGVVTRGEITSTMDARTDKIAEYFQDEWFEDTTAERNVEDQKTINLISSKIAKLYWSYLSAIQSKAQKLLAAGDGDTYVEWMKARQEFFNKLFGEGTIKDPGPGKGYVFTEKLTDKEFYTPVFPVSDANGYEVVGTLPYGRGVDIELYSDLIQSTKENGQSFVSGQGIDASAIDKVEKFLIAWTATRQDKTLDRIEAAEKSLSIFSSEDQRAILASFSVDSSEALGNVMLRIDNEDPSPKAKVRNTPVTSYFRGQSVFGDTAASNLASMDFSEGMCACKGSDGAFLLQAFTSEKIMRFGDEVVQDQLEATAFSSEKNWTNTKKALSGDFYQPQKERFTDTLRNPEKLFGSAIAEANEEIRKLAETINEEAETLNIADAEALGIADLIIETSDETGEE